jgi:ADP-ribosyl-[dinitrogen reductase] hydrolase
MSNVGTITGLAVGDALGMPFETRRPDDPAYVGWDGSYRSSDYHGLEPGQWTDDTQMSVALGKSLVRDGRYYPFDAASNYLDWFHGEPRGMGRSTRLAMEELDRSRKWTCSGVLHAEGNGTAMRAAPLGLVCADLDQVVEWARIDAGITHVSLEARQGSVVVAGMVTCLASGMDRRAALEAVCGCLSESRVRQALRDLESRVPFDERRGPSANVTESVPAALWVFMGTRDFGHAVRWAVELGGDTDTVASMVGAMAGTYYGYDQIPQHWLEGLERADELRELELALAVQRRATSPLPP